MAAVLVERLPVEILGLGRFGFDHLQIVLRKASGPAGPAQDDWFVIEGIREAEGSDVRLAVEGWHGGTTLSEANGGRTGAALVARIGTPESRAPREIATGTDAMELWASLVSHAADFHAQKFPYIPMTLPGSPLPIVNSSSLVVSLLHHAGIDPAAALPAGLRLSPGRSTLLGTSGDDTQAAGNGFTTVLAGAGNDRLSGSGSRAASEKLFGGRGDDVFHWTKGVAIIHGGEPGLPYAGDGTDSIDYAGAGEVKLAAPPAPAPHVRPDFIATYKEGEDHLFSIEEIVWDERSDRLSIGPGVGLESAPLRIDFRGEDPFGTGDVIDLSQADVGFDVVAKPSEVLDLRAREEDVGAKASAIRVHGAEWIVGSAHGDRIAISANVRGIEGGAGDDVLDLRQAGRIFVSPGSGNNTLIVGEGELVVQGGGGVDRYVLTEPSASLVVQNGTPRDAIVVTWKPVHASAAYGRERPHDLMIRLAQDAGRESAGVIRIEDHCPGDLGLHAGRTLALRETAEGWQLVSREEGPRPADGAEKLASGTPSCPGAESAQGHVGIADDGDVSAWVAVLLSF